MLLTFDLSAPLLCHTDRASFGSCVNLDAGNCCAQGRTESAINIRPRNESAAQYRLTIVRIKQLIIAFSTRPAPNLFSVPLEYIKKCVWIF